jgi:hypothetical protein
MPFADVVHESGCHDVCIFYTTGDDAETGVISMTLVCRLLGREEVKLARTQELPHSPYLGVAQPLGSQNVKESPGEVAQRA